MDFVPQPQLPTGLAEEVIRLAQQKGQNLAQGISQAGQAIGEGIARRKQIKDNSLSPEQANAIIAGLPSTMSTFPGNRVGQTGPSPAGYSGPPSEQPTSGLYPRGLNTAAQNLLKEKLGIQGRYTVAELKGNQTASQIDTKEHVKVDDSVKKTYEMAGKPLPDGVTHVDRTDFGKTSDLAKAKMEVQARADASAKATAAKSSAAATKLDNKRQDTWLKIDRVINPTVAVRGSLLGVVGINNARANRALKILNDPNSTASDIQFAVNDLAGIMQGGAPHEEALKKANYGSLIQDLTKWASYLTNNPVAANSPEMVKHLIGIIQPIKDIDNRIIMDNVNQHEPSFREFIKQNPQEWFDYRNKLLNNLKEGSVTPEERMAELEKYGLKGDAAYAQMHKEGF